MSDDDRAAILRRRAQLASAALSCLVASCSEDGAHSQNTAHPQPCLTFGCAEGYTHVPGARQELTARSQQTDPQFCVPASAAKTSAPNSASAEPSAGPSAPARDR